MLADVRQWRDTYCRAYAFAMPSTEAVDALVDLGPLVEVGAGTGWWASCIADAGGDIVAYDIADTAYRWFDVQYGGTKALRRHADRTLFLCWPTYGTDFGYRALKSHRGERFVYVGEGRGGCCADDRFFDLLDADWVLERRISIPSWPECGDDLTVWRRR